jgi:hypothetical protein
MTNTATSQNRATRRVPPVGQKGCLPLRGSLVDSGF